MCEYCDGGDECVVWKDVLDNSWYLAIPTGEWDEHNDDWIYTREFINYCPYCGRRLS